MGRGDGYSRRGMIFTILIPKGGAIPPHPPSYRVGYTPGVSKLLTGTVYIYFNKNVTFIIWQLLIRYTITNAIIYCKQCPA